MPTPSNAINEATTGIVGFTGTAFTSTAATAHAVQVGGSTSSTLTNLSVGATGTVLAGSTGADPSFTATPSVTSITFGAGTALSSYAEGTFSPTIIGASSAGTTTYVSQNGYYTRIGNFVFIYGFVQISGASGTGNALIGGLPFTVKNQTLGYPPGSLIYSGNVTWPWPASTTMLAPLPLINTTTAQITGSGSTLASAQLQMANAALILYFSLAYQI